MLAWYQDQENLYMLISHSSCYAVTAYMEVKRISNSITCDMFCCDTFKSFPERFRRVITHQLGITSIDTFRTFENSTVDPIIDLAKIIQTNACKVMLGYCEARRDTIRIEMDWNVPMKLSKWTWNVPKWMCKRDHGQNCCIEMFPEPSKCSDTLPYVP